MAHLGPISREVIMQTWIDKAGHLSETFWYNSQFQSIKKQLAEGPSNQDLHLSPGSRRCLGQPSQNLKLLICKLASRNLHPSTLQLGFNSIIIRFFLCPAFTKVWSNVTHDQLTPLVFCKQRSYSLTGWSREQFDKLWNLMQHLPNGMDAKHCVCAPTTSLRSLDPSEAIYWELSPMQQLLHSWVELLGEAYGLIPLHQTFLQLGIMSHDYHPQVGLARAVGNSSRASKLKPFITLTVSKSSSCMSGLTFKWILLAITSSKRVNWEFYIRPW
jgi:hypothetical protein